MKYFLEIVSIDAPATALEGETVVITVKVRNKHTTGMWIITTNGYDGQTMDCDEGWATVWAGETYSFHFTFTMPGKNISGIIGAFYYGVDKTYHLDDQGTYNIKLVELKGDISVFSIEDYRKV